MLLNFFAAITDCRVSNEDENEAYVLQLENFGYLSIFIVNLVKVSFH
jgi:hypothetical protein